MIDRSNAKLTGESYDVDEVKKQKPIRAKLIEQDDTKSLFVSTDQEREAYRKKGPMGPIESFGKMGYSEVLPFGSIYSSIELSGVNSAYERLLADDYSDNKDRLDDENMLRPFMKEQEEMQIRGQTFWGKVTEVVASAPAFMMEFQVGGKVAGKLFGEAAKGGAAVGAEASGRWALGRMRAAIGASKLVAERRSIQGLLKAASYTGKTITQSAVMGARVPAGYYKDRLNQGVQLTDKGVALIKEIKEAPSTTFMRSVGDLMIEVLSEKLGETLINPALEGVGAALSSTGSAKKIIQFKGRLPEGFADKFVETATKVLPHGRFKKVLREHGYHGVLAEMGEERVGDFLRAVTGVDNRDMSIYDKAMEAIFPDSDKLLVELGAFSVMGGGSIATQTLINKIEASGLTREEANAYVMKLSELQRDGKLADIQELEKLRDDLRKEPIKDESTMLDRVIRKRQNEHFPIEQASKRAIERMKAEGKEPTAKQKLQVLVRLTLGIGRGSDQALHLQTFTFDEEGDTQWTGEGLSPIIQEFERGIQSVEGNIDAREKDFSDYLIATRILEDLQDRKEVKTDDDTIERAKQTILALQEKYQEKYQVFNDTAKRFYAFNSRIYKLQVDSGLISQKSYDNITSKNKHHVTFRGAINEPAPESNRQVTGGKFAKVDADIIRISDGTTNVEHVMYNTERNVREIMGKAARNNVLRSLYDLAQYLPEYVRVVEGKELEIEEKTAEIEALQEEIAGQPSATELKQMVRKKQSLKRDITRLKRNERKNSKDLNKQEGQFDKLDDKLSDVEEDIATSEEDIQRLEDEIEESKTEDDITELEREIKRLQSKANALDNRKPKMIDQLDANNTELSKLNAEILEANNKAKEDNDPNLRKRIDSLSRRIATKNKKSSSLTKSIADNQRERDDLSKKLEEAEKELAQIEQEYGIADNIKEIEKLKQNIDKQKKVEKELNKEINKLDKGIPRSDEKLTGDEAKINEAEFELESLISELEASKEGDSVVKLSRKVASAQKKVNKLRKHKPKLNNRNNVIPLFIDGDPKAIEVSDELFAALADKTDVELSVFWRVNRAIARGMRAAITMVPDFWVVNLFKDQISTVTQSEIGFRPFIDPVLAASHIIRKSDTYQRWIASGAGFSSLVETTGDNMKNAYRELAGKKHLLKRMNIIDNLEKMAQFSEEMTKLGAFIASKRKGNSDQQAAFDSRETMDFGVRGSGSRGSDKWQVTLSVIPFLNASIQGITKTGRSFKDNPIGTTVKSLMYLTVPAMTIAWLNWDDEEIKNLPRWKTDMYFPVRVGEKIFFFPKPHALGAIFATSVERFVDFTLKEDPRAMDGWVKGTLDQMVPFTDAGGLLPPALKFLVEQGANYSFFKDRSIVSKYKKDLEPRKQSNRGSTDAGKFVGDKLNISPARIDHAIQSFIPGASRYVMPVANAVTNSIKESAGEKVYARPSDLGRMPFLQRFLAPRVQGSYSKSVVEFRDLSEQLRKIQRTASTMRKDGDKETPKYVKLHEVEIDFAKQAGKLTRQFSKWNKEIDYVTRSDMEGQEKLTLINKLEKLQTLEASNFLKQYDKAIK